MKILFVETCLSGHHFEYINCLKGFFGKNHSIELFLPENNLFKLNKKTYLKWVKTLNKKIAKFKPDIVHFLYGDDIYFSAGFGLKFGRAKTVITFHQVRRSFFHDASYKLLSKKFSAIIVHTTSLAKELQDIGISNVYHVEYPCFYAPEEDERAKKKLGIPGNTKTFLAFGGTRYDKGLDILLNAFKRVNKDYCLIIAGKEEDIKKEEILSLSSTYLEKVLLRIGFVSNDDKNIFFSAADIVILPYRRCFDGASGPLSEGVACKKAIIGPNHGSLGSLIVNNCLGYSFESENEKELIKVIDKSIDEDWQPNQRYLEYRSSLSIDAFITKHEKLYEELLNQIR